MKSQLSSQHPHTTERRIVHAGEKRGLIELPENIKGMPRAQTWYCQNHPQKGKYQKPGLGSNFGNFQYQAKASGGGCQTLILLALKSISGVGCGGRAHGGWGRELLHNWRCHFWKYGSDGEERSKMKLKASTKLNETHNTESNYTNHRLPDTSPHPQSTTLAGHRAVRAGPPKQEH